MQWTRYARVIGLVILIVVTVVGCWQFLSGDPRTVVSFWRDKLSALPQIFVLACLDVGLEGLGWLWVYSRMGIRSMDSGGVLSFLSGRAGMLLPAQLNRLIRPDSMARLQRGTMGECLKAEGVCFVLDLTSVGALIVGLAAWYLNPLAGPVAALAVIVLMVLLGNRVAEKLSGTRLEIPKDFWWRWQTFAIVIVEMGGWVAHGAALYLLINTLPGDPTLWGSLFFSASSSVLGAGSGLPGGIGATEGLLGASLSIMKVPVEHMALAIGAFRLLTFWMWIPIGWLALVAIRRRSKREITNAEAT